MSVCTITCVIHIYLSRNIWCEDVLGRDETDEMHSSSSQMFAVEIYHWCQKGAIASMNFD